MATTVLTLIGPPLMAIGIIGAATRSGADPASVKAAALNLGEGWTGLVNGMHQIGRVGRAARRRFRHRVDVRPGVHRSHRRVALRFGGAQNLGGRRETGAVGRLGDGSGTPRPGRGARGGARGGLRTARRGGDGGPRATDRVARGPPGCSPNRWRWPPAPVEATCRRSRRSSAWSPWPRSRSSWESEAGFRGRSPASGPCRRRDRASIRYRCHGCSWRHCRQSCSRPPPSGGGIEPR